MQSKLAKHILFNDPIYGFIIIESTLLLQLIGHPYFQRLRRISQMGLSHLVYPGAHHTRFEHALGCMHLMQRAIEILRKKGVSISESESEAMQIAILLHDIGHGPFSHAMENVLLPGIPHEAISIRIMELLNKEFNGALDLAIEIFTGVYPRKFMRHLIMGQIDIDRLDYLKRDSFYTGVVEGNINIDRILSLINVHDNQLVFEEKGIYSLENFLLARRLMYWQVYLHKTSVSAELLLVKTIERAKSSINQQTTNFLSSALQTLLKQDEKTFNFDDATLKDYLELDDSDIIHALKVWRNSSDRILKTTASQLIDRRLFRIEIATTPFTEIQIQEKKKLLLDLQFDPSEIVYLVFSGNISNQTYSLQNENILLLSKSTSVVHLDQAIRYLDFEQFSTPEVKYYLCYPKSLVSP